MTSTPSTPLGADAGTMTRLKPESRRLGQPARGLRHLAQLAGQADLAAGHQVGRHQPRR